MTDATAAGVTAAVATAMPGMVAANRPEDLAEPNTKVPRRGLTRNRALGRDVAVAVESVQRAAGGDPWTVAVSLDGLAWDVMVPADRTRDEAVEVGWREVTLRAGALRPARTEG